MIRLIHGDDEFTVANSLKAYLDALGPPELRAPNVTIFEAPNAPMGEVFAAARISPFLTDRRAVVVKGMLKPFETRGEKVRSDWESFGERISSEGMQIANDLIFVENVRLRLSSGPLKALASIAEVERHDVPVRRDRPQWIRKRFQFHGAAASAAAIGRFNVLGGDDIRRLDSEIQKLALYADGRTLQPDDIDLMVADASQDRIFNVMDAIIEGRHNLAIGGVQNLIANGESIEGIFALLTRQVRILIVAAHLLQKGVSRQEIGRRLRLNMDWLVNKTCQQALRVGSDRLRRMHLHMLEIDIGMKTGRADRRLAVEMLIAGFVAR
jgi:DNA polymerase-3 subunit delta